MIKEIAQGMAFTLRQMFRKPLTVQWPEEQKMISPRHRGRHILHRYDNGLERCIGCELCAGACPVGCIYVEGAENDPDNPVSPGERYAKRYEINLMRCIYCGYCAEACPTEAITLGSRYEMAEYRRERTVVTKSDLLEAWPFKGEVSDSGNPYGAGADQRGRGSLDPGVNPRDAWSDREKADPTAGSNDWLPGHGGIAVTPPAVKEPTENKS